jgi:molybdate transport system substrate-binding protein
MTTQHSPAGAPLKVFVSNSLRGVFDTLRPEFERASGYALDISYDPAQVMLRRIGTGESADLVILGAAAIDTLVAQGKVDGASRRTLGRCGSGLAVRAGAPRPDIGSVDALKRALLEAKSIIHTSEGASGIHFARLVETLGIADAVKAKARTQPGGLVAQRVASGEVELGVQQIPELLAVQGVDLVGPLPADVQAYSTSTAGIFMDTKQRVAAQALVDFLATPHSVDTMRAKGFEPA